jgi:hypothetical protein
MSISKPKTRFLFPVSPQQGSERKDAPNGASQFLVSAGLLIHRSVSESSNTGDLTTQYRGSINLELSKERSKALFLVCNDIMSGYVNIRNIQIAPG